MEDIHCVKDLITKGDHICKLDLKDAYLQYTSPAENSSTGRGQFTSSSPLWAISSPESLHKGVKTGTSSSESCRDTSSGIPRRLPHYQEVQGGCRSCFPEDHESLTKSWVCDQYGKITDARQLEQ